MNIDTILSNDNGSLRAALESAIDTGNKVQSAQNKLNEQRTGGIYTPLTEAAAGLLKLANGEHDAAAEAFGLVWDGLVKDIKHNVGGVAVKLKCKKSGGKSKSYKVPSAASSAASVLRDSLKYGIALSEDNATRSFTAIRGDLQEAKRKAEMLAKHETARAMHEALSALQEAAGELAELLAFVEANDDRSEGMPWCASVKGMLTDATHEIAATVADINGKREEAAEEAGETVAEEAEAKTTTRKRKAS